jgi:hypothetical protein
MDMAAFGASQRPMLKAGTRRDNALNCHAGLASGTAWALSGAERQVGRRLRVGHGVDPGKVTSNRKYRAAKSGFAITILRRCCADLGTALNRRRLSDVAAALRHSESLDGSDRPARAEAVSLGSGLPPNHPLFHKRSEFGQDASVTTAKPAIAGCARPSHRSRRGSPWDDVCSAPESRHPADGWGCPLSALGDILRLGWT